MKKYFTAFLAFIIYFNVFSQAHASKNYNVKTITYDPLERVINATILDQIAEKTMQKSAKVPVTASATGSTVASMIRLGVAGAVIYGLVEGVGWIIENGIVKKPSSNPDPELTVEYLWSSQVIAGYQTSVNNACPNAAYGTYRRVSINYQTPDLAICVYQDVRFPDDKNFRMDVYAMREKNPKYNPGEPVTYIPVDDNELGDQINRSPQAPQILPDVYNPNNPHGGTAPKITADALDNSTPKPETEPTGSSNEKPNVDTDGDGIPDKYDPTKPSLGKEFTLPEFCSWATTMCEWYKKYKEDSKQAEAQRESEKTAWQREEEARQKEEAQREKERTFWEKITDFISDDSFPKDPEDTLPDDDKDDPNIPLINDSLISTPGQCPAPFTTNIPDPFGGQHTITFSYDTFCYWLSKMRPWVILTAHLIGLSILGGRNTVNSENV